MAHQQPQDDHQTPVPPTDQEQASRPIEREEIEPEKLYVEWEAASRPFKKRDREYYTTIAIIVFLLSLILLFAGQFLPIAVVISIGFLSYVLASVPPDRISNALTTYGLHSDKQFFFWEELGRFWYTTKFGQTLVHIETARFPGRITLLVNDDSAADVHEVLSAYLRNEQPLPTFFDNAAQWLQEKIPLDREEPEKPAPPPVEKKKSDHTPETTSHS